MDCLIKFHPSETVYPTYLTSSHMLETVSIITVQTKYRLFKIKRPEAKKKCRLYLVEIFPRNVKCHHQHILGPDHLKSSSLSAAVSNIVKTELDFIREARLKVRKKCLHLVVPSEVASLGIHKRISYRHLCRQLCQKS